MSVLESWDERLRQSKSRRTRETYGRLVKEFFDFFEFSPERAGEELEPYHLEEFVSKSSKNPASLLITLSALSYFIRFLHEEGLLSSERYGRLRRAVEEVRRQLRPSVKPAPPKPLSEREIKLVFEGVRGRKYEKVYTLFLYSGIKVGEYESLTGKSFYLDKSGLLWVRLKGRMAPVLAHSEEETVKITERLLKWIENYEENLKVSRGALQVYTDRLSKRLGVSLSLRRFRQTYIANLISRGLPVELVKAFAGYSREDLLRDYM